MSTIRAVYENGVFRPVSPVDLANGTEAIVETDAMATERVRAARRRVLETLSRSYETSLASDVLETHNDHSP